MTVEIIVYPCRGYSAQMKRSRGIFNNRKIFRIEWYVNVKEWHTTFYSMILIKFKIKNTYIYTYIGKSKNVFFVLEKCLFFPLCFSIFIL